MNGRYQKSRSRRQSSFCDFALLLDLLLLGKTSSRSRAVGDHEAWDQGLRSLI